MVRMGIGWTSRSFTQRCGLELCGKKRGFRISGGEVDTERMAKVLLDEYRSGKLGNLTFETPQDLESREAAHGRD